MLSHCGQIGLQLKQAGIYNPLLLFAYPSIQILATQHRFISLASKGLWIWGDFISQAEVGSTQEIVSTKWSLGGLNNLILFRIIHKSSQMRMEEIIPSSCLSVLTTSQLASLEQVIQEKSQEEILQCHFRPSLRKHNHHFWHILFVRNKSVGQLGLMGMGSRFHLLRRGYERICGHILKPPHISFPLYLNSSYSKISLIHFIQALA